MVGQGPYPRLPPARQGMRARLALLRAEAAAVRATAYRVALNSEDEIPDASGSIVRLSFAELAQRATQAAIDLYGLDAPKWSARMAWGMNIWTRFRKPLPADRVDQAVDAFCAKLLAGAPNAIRWTKILTNMELKRIARL